MSEVNFFVVGCPRSGTAWLSNAMNHGQEVFCFHEAERDLLMGAAETQQDIVLRRLYEKPHFASGNVSSGMISWTLLPSDGPLVIVHRDWDEVEASLRFAMFEWGQKDFHYDADAIRFAYENFAAAHDHAMVVMFEDLFAVDTLVQIWKHCLPMLMPPVDRFEELVRHKVTLKQFDYFPQREPN